MLKSLILFFSLGLSFAADFSAFIGEWKGDCSVKLISGASKVGMELQVQQVSSNNFSWIITYIKPQSTEKRNYNLIIDKKLDGNFIIDENNGLLLRGTLVDNIMFQLFHLKNGAIITTRNEVFEDLITIEMPMFDSANPKVTTTLNLQNTVYSYQFTGLQKCTLLKKKS